MNKIYKVIWSVSQNIWVAVGEFAKGKQKSNAGGSVSSGRLTLSTTKPPPGELGILAVAIMATVASQSAFAITPEQCASETSCEIVTTATQLSTALSTTGTATTILLANNITLDTNIAVQLAESSRKEVVIDGGGYSLHTGTAVNQYSFTLNDQTNPAWGGSGSLTLENFAAITSANASPKIVLLDQSTTTPSDVNVIVNNIGSLPDGKLAALGIDSPGGEANTVSQLVIGNVSDPVALTGDDKQLALATKIALTGTLDITSGAGSNSAVFWTNGDAASSVIDYADTAHLSFTGGQYTAGDTAYTHMLADGAYVNLATNQNVFGLQNNGVQIGSYAVGTGFGTGAVVILHNQAGGAITGDAISNANAAADGIIQNGPGQNGDVIFNLAAGSELAASGTGILATKDTATTGNIYISSGALINAPTGISASSAGSGNILVDNTSAGVINAATGISATSSLDALDAATINIINNGIINSTATGITLDSTADQTVKIDNSGGTINAASGTGINVLGRAVLDLIGGIINTTGSASAITLADTTVGNILSNVTLNLAGSGGTVIKADATKLELQAATFNTVNGTVLDQQSNINFAGSIYGRNSINVSGNGTGILTNLAGSGTLQFGALDINVTGGGTGINTTSNSINLAGADLTINVSGNTGTALDFSTNASDSNISTLGQNVKIIAPDASAVNITGSYLRKLNNDGTIIGKFTSTAQYSTLELQNYGIVDSVSALRDGDDQLFLYDGSQTGGNFDLGNGNNSVTIYGGAKVTAGFSAGTGNDTLTFDSITAADTVLGAFNAGGGTNTLSFINSNDSLATDTTLQNFTNINLTNSQIGLVSANNLLASGTLNIDDASTLSFTDTFDGTLAAALSHLVAGDGTVTVDSGAAVTLDQPIAFEGTWNIQTGGSVTASGTPDFVGRNLTLDGSLQLNGTNAANIALTGSGLLSVNNDSLSDKSFNFSEETGNAFAGTLDLHNADFSLANENSTALTDATLKLSGGSVTTVGDGEQAIRGLSMDGGALVFALTEVSPGVLSATGTVTATNIDVRSGGTVRTALPEDFTAPSISGEPVLALDEGIQLATLATGLADGSGHELTLTDLVGGALGTGTVQALENPSGSTTVAQGTFNYGLTTGTDKTGLYLNYGLQLVQLLGKGSDALILSGTTAGDGTQANDLSAQINGSGDLAIDSADSSTVSLSNAGNDYTGATYVRAGNLLLTANSALGQTSLLALSGGTKVDLNGTTQTVGQLTTAAGSTLEMDNGQLTVSTGGQVDGALTGGGVLTLTGGTLNIAQANSGYTGSTDIGAGATAHLTQLQSLGAGGINNNGTVNLDNVSGAFTNPLTGGNGNLLLSNGANVQLTADNSGYSGRFTTQANTILTATGTQNLGNGSVSNNGELILNNSAQWNLANAISGTGALIKQGSGTVNLTSGTLSAGLTRIEDGALLLGASTNAATSSSSATTSFSTLSTLSTLALATASAAVDLVSNVVISAAGTFGGTGAVTGNVENAGTLLMPHAAGGDFGTFTINGNYTGDNGTLVFDSVLAGDSSVTDKLVITGNTSGNSKVVVDNIGGEGALTKNGIKLIDVGGQSAGQFSLEGRAVAGAYEYFLYQGGLSSPNDGDWYLRNNNDTLRSEAGSYGVNLAAANTMFVSSLSDRTGETLYTDPLTGEQKTTSMWLRNQGSHNRSRDDTGELRSQDNRYVMQLGGDIAQWSHNAQDLWRLGVMGGYANSSSSTVSQATGYRSTGSVDGYSVGLYGTWFANEEQKTGAYVDSWAQYSWFNNKVDGQDISGEEYKSKGFTASVEGGYAFKLGENGLNSYFIQPKAQVVWMGVKADDHTEANGTRVSGDGNGNVQTRLGTKAFINALRPGVNGQAGSVMKPYIEVSWIHNSQDFGATLDGVDVKQTGAGNIGEIKLGVEGQITKQLNLYGNVAQQVGNKGYSDTTAMLGVKYGF